ncbi:cellulose synthase subunit BcsC-related outer membrane protein [Pseudomonas sp.]|uniref:cellulose biosynthesis protein BcsC n=1 Tax=Pseudomonas sp. TaxID=306 RepID=UPI0028AD6770|nr:cellulose synthase subunit BcsC-related outer membrane protein [Pseudomonas sp.]
MFRKSPLTLGLLAILLQSQAWADDADPKRLLIEQGQFWQAKDKSARAAEVWERLLLLDAQQPEALYGLGLIGVQNKQLAKAGQYLDRLRALTPPVPQALRLAQDIRLAQPANAQLLEQARLAVDNEERGKADDLYRQALGNQPAQGLVGREYYNNLGFIEGQWAQARAGFERLRQQEPGDPYVALFYAKHQVRREDTREAGILALQGLAKRQDIGGDADETWRLALTWLGAPSKAQQPLFDAFLAVHPDDSEIRGLLNKGRNGARPAASSAWQQDPHLAKGLNALERGDRATAERELSARLQAAPNDTDALGGLGVLRQQQERLAEAEQLLGRAVKGGGTSWQKALDEVRYWSLLQQAEQHRRQGRTAQAREAIQQALRLDPKAAQANLAMADLLTDAGDGPGAESRYRQVLVRQPSNTQARVGLVAALTQQGKQAEALQALQQLPASEQAKLGGMGKLRANLALEQAKRAEQRGDTGGQRAALEDALRNDPNSTWARYGLAKLYQDAGARDEASSLMDGLARAQPNDPEALYISALFAIDQGDWNKARGLLSDIPAGNRGTQVTQLLRDAEFQQRLQEIDTLNRRGSYQEARVFLARLEPLAQDSPERQAQLASAYAAAKDDQRALVMLRGLIAGSARNDPGLTLTYAGVLLQTGHDQEVAVILRDFQSQALDPQQRRQYDDLLFLYRVRKADQQREQGDLAGAYDTLSPALIQRPQDPLAGAALARLYATSGDLDKAAQLYRPLVQRNPGDAQLLVGAADVAAQQRDDGVALGYVKKALNIAPDDPDMLVSAARIYRTQGRTAKAAELLGKVVAQEARQQTERFVASTPASQPQNPFARTPGSSGQSVDDLLTPIDTRAPASRLAAGVASGRPDNPFAATGSDGRADPRAGMSEAAKALSDVRQTRSAYVTQGLEVSGNDSENGLGRRVAVQAPLEASVPLGENRLALRVTSVALRAGRVDGEAASRFGGGPAASAVSQEAGSQRDAGVGVAVAFENQSHGVKADIGTTPQGFLYDTVVGGVTVERPFAGHPDLHWSATASRRAVTESVTSFAGSEDPRTGQKWGGVSATGGRLELGYDNRKVGTYVYGSLHGLRGNHVENNTRAELGSGVYWYLQNDDTTQLTLGLSLMAMGFENNQNFYTYGHGGYFSPQSFFALGVPVSWARRFDRWSVAVKGSVGVQFFDQDGADYYPTDGALQAAATTVLGRDARYASNSKTGFGYSLAGNAEYQLGSSFFLGGQVGLNNAQNYRELEGGLYVRYTFERQDQPMALPVSPYRSPYSN